MMVTEHAITILVFLSRNDVLENSGHRGWYFTKYLSKDISSWEADGNILAWARTIPGEPHTFPKEVHVSDFLFKSLKHIKCIIVCMYLA